MEIVRHKSAITILDTSEKTTLSTTNCVVGWITSLIFFSLNCVRQLTIPKKSWGKSTLTSHSTLTSWEINQLEWHCYFSSGKSPARRDVAVQPSHDGSAQKLGIHQPLYNGWRARGRCPPCYCWVLFTNHEPPTTQKLHEPLYNYLEPTIAGNSKFMATV